MLGLARSRSGETIIEVMLAVSILGFVLGISYASAGRSLRASQDALERSTATHMTMTMIDVVKTHAERFNDPTYNRAAPWNNATARALVFPSVGSDTRFCVSNQLDDYPVSGAPPLPVAYSDSEPFCQHGVYRAYVTAHHLPSSETYEYTAHIEWPSIVSGTLSTTLMRYRWVMISPGGL